MMVYEKKQYIFILRPNESEDGERRIFNWLCVEKDLWDHYEINPPTIDNDGNSVYLVHTWE